MPEAIYLAVGLAVGGVMGWLWASRRGRAAEEKERSALEASAAGAQSVAGELREQLAQREAALEQLRQDLGREREERVKTQTQLEESAKRFEEQAKILSEAETRLKETFDSLSAKALRANGEQFLGQAKKTLETILADARGDLGKRQEAINSLVKPVAESLKRYDEQTRALEAARQKAYGSLSEQVKALTVSNQQLQQETGKLVTSLRDPKVRGRWGEIALRRAAELAGMSDHVDFEQQVTLAGDDDTRYRPDMVVRLPGGRTVVIDAKAVLDAYLDAVAATDDESRRACLEHHASQIRSRVRELSSKSYWDKLDTAPEFVVLFLPAESFFSAAVEMDRDLIEDAIESRVVLASPTTLIALLKAIAFGWRQEKMAENARQISELGRTLFDRMRLLAENFSKVGTNLDRAVRTYNEAVGSLEARVLPAARRFKELGAAGGDDIAVVPPLEHAPREIDERRLDEA